MDTNTANRLASIVARHLIALVGSSADFSCIIDSSDQEPQKGEDPQHQEGPDAESATYTFTMNHAIDRQVEGRRGPGSRQPVGNITYTVTVKAGYSSFDGE